MIVLTAGDSNFREMISISWEQAEKFGYDFLAYDLNDLGFGELFLVKPESFARNPIPPCYHKPMIVADCLRNIEDGVQVIYLDGDAILNAPVDEVFRDEFDVGVTLRKKDEQGTACPKITGYIQAGVMFFVNSQKVRGFVSNWEEATKEFGSDQWALNELLDAFSWEERNVTVDVGDLRVKVLATEEYNCYYLDKGFSEENKIVHFKGKYRRYFDKRNFYCRNGEA